MKSVSLMWAAVPSIYKIGTVIVLAVVLLAGSFVAVTKAYNGIYDRGVAAGEQKVNLKNANALLASIAAQQKLQLQLKKKTKAFRYLYTQYTDLQAQGPEVVTKYVRQDPVFAASQRPADLHALRVRELKSLQEAAATRSN